MNKSDYVSLLWKNNSPHFFEISHKSVIDLDVAMFDMIHEKLMEENVMSVLTKLPTEQATVQYRQAIMADLDKFRPLLQVFTDVSGRFHEQKNMIKFAFEREYTLYNVLKRLEESEDIISGLIELDEALHQHPIESEGLIAYRSLMDDLIKSDIFKAYQADMKSIRSMSRVSGIKIGLNLDGDLSPVEAIVLSLEEEPFRYSRSMKKVGRIIGYGITELKKIPRRIFAPETTIPKEDLNELEKIIEPAMQQLIKFSDKFNNSLLDMFMPLKEELLLYQFGIEVKDHLTYHGFGTSMLTFHESFPAYISGMYNVNLAYRLIDSGREKEMVNNDLSIDDNGNIFILTGANRGGKTTYTQAIGQVHWLGLLGLYVPASSANVRMIDGLYIHFPSEEEETVLFGRLGEECQRFAEIFTSMTPKSLLLMNESFSGTSHLESLTIAKETLKAIQILGATCFFNTHLHELAIQIDELNASDLPIRFRNLISGSSEAHQSFKIKDGEPLGKSYALEIAKKYGVTYKQLITE